MRIFKIEVQELLARVIEVDADSLDEAISKVEEMYKKEEIVLDYDDLSKRDILPVELIEEKDSLIRDIIEYLYIDEQNHFEESEEPDNHIFLKIERLKKMID